MRQWVGFGVIRGGVFPHKNPPQIVEKNTVKRGHWTALLGARALAYFHSFESLQTVEFSVVERACKKRRYFYPFSWGSRQEHPY